VQILAIFITFLILERVGIVRWYVRNDFKQKDFSNREIVSLLDNYNEAKESFAYYRIKENITNNAKTKNELLSLLWDEYNSSEYVDNKIIKIIELMAIAEDSKVLPVLDKMLESEYFVASVDEKTKSIEAYYRYRVLANLFYKEYFKRDKDGIYEEVIYNSDFWPDFFLELYSHYLNLKPQKKIPIWK
jgi:hypothetical protein